MDSDLRREALAYFMKGFRQHYERHLSSPEIQYDARIGEGDHVLRALQEDGCSLTRIEPERKAQLVKLTEDYAVQLHERLDQLERPRFKDGQHHLDPDKDATIFAAVDELFHAEHVYAAGSAYAGRQVKLKTMAVQVNTARSTALTYGELNDAGLPKPRTRYLHVDSALWPPLKVLIYLNEVGPDDGPFRYVVGSHRIASEFELMVRKTNDKLGIQRERFMALPLELRKYTDFGGVMDPKGPHAKALMSRERQFCDGVSDLILFDFNGVHRGGFVRKGPRYMLQCCFEGSED